MEQFLIFKRIMMLRKRHGTGVKPAVNHLRHAFHRLAADRAGEGDLIDIRPVQLHLCRLRIAAALRQLCPAADTFLTSALAFPYRKRSPPVTIAGNSPILDIFQPVPETSLSDRLRNPVNGIVVADQILLDRRHLDKPGLSRIVNERRIAAPAMRIVMLKFRRVKQLSLRIEIPDDLRVCLLYKQSGVGSLLRHFALSVHKLDKRKIVVSSDPCIVLTKGRRDMHDTGTVRHSDIGIAGHKMCLLVLFVCDIRGTCKQRFIFLVFQLFSGTGVQNLIGLYAFLLLAQLSQHSVEQGLCHIIGIAVCCLDLAVGLRWIHAQCHVGGQRPRGGRPCQKVSILPDHLETHHGGALLYGLIPLCHLL